MALLQLGLRMAKLGRFSLPLSGRVPCRSKPARQHRTASTSSRQTPARRQAQRASSPRRRELPISDAAGALGSGSGLEDSSHTTLSFQRCPSTVGMAAAAAPEWATKEPCLMGIDEAGRGPVLGPMVYGCMYCARSYHNTLATLAFADSKTLKEEKREELFENLKANSSIGWEVDVICPKDLSAKMLKRSKVNLNEISHNSAMGLIKKVLEMGVLLAEVYIDTVGDPEKYRIKMTEKFPGIKFVVAKKADSLYPVVSGASIVAKVTRDRTLRNWVFDETAQNMHMNTGSGYPADPGTKQWLEDHKHPVFGFPTLVRFSWGTCTTFFKDAVEVTWESDELDEDGSGNGSVKRPKRQVKLSSLGFTGFKNKSEEIESCGKGRCKFFQARKLELVKEF